MVCYQEANKMAAIVNSDMLFEPTLRRRLQDQSNAQDFFPPLKTATEMQSETEGI